ncbi:MAG: hypothetical protein IKY27_08145 [Bacteroidales bacterium]|nr:hypothetical protein [Bacteroidales bacterium]
MSLGIYILIIIAIIAVGYLTVFLFDYLLIRGAFRIIVGKAKKHLDADRLAEVIKKYMENRRQKWVFGTYMSSVILIISGGGFIPFIRANLFVASEKNVINLQLWLDNSVPPAVLIVGLVGVTFVYFLFLYFSNLKYKTDILSSAAKVINRELEFVPTQDWFKEKSELNIKNLGKKFDLSINFKYELFEDAFASTCRDERVALLFVEERSKLLADFARAKEFYKDKIDEATLNEVETAVRQIVDSLSLKHFDAQCIETVVQAIDNVQSILRQAIIENKASYDDYYYSCIHSDLGKIQSHIENDWIQSIKEQSLIVYGKGGYGKTHLLAKLVQRRLDENLPTIFVLGRVITDTNIPMDQILNTLDVKCKKKTFFEALDKYGRQYGRVLMVVDGINEGVGLSLWENHLLNFLNEIHPYKNIGMIVSVRTTGGDSWIDRFIRDEGFPSYRHFGFEKNVSGAVEYMFKSFSVPLPVWPIMNSEFKNPLLLTLFCQTHQGDNTPPKHESRIEIIENYINHFNSRLASCFHYSSSTSVLQDVLYKIAQRMIADGSRWKMSQRDLLAIIGSNQTIQAEAERFLNALVDEGILNEYYFSEKSHFYTFGYDTMGGYLIANSMVASNNINGDLLSDETVLEALTDVVPTSTGKELFEILKDEDVGYRLVDMFVDGLPMRTCLTASGKALLQRYVDDNRWHDVFEIIARVPYHKEWPLNASLLDEVLKPLKIVSRDALWTTFISGYTIVKDYLIELAEWAKSVSSEVVTHLDKEVLMLICRQLVWTLTTTDLALRDQTSRALVNLLRNEQKCLLQCIKDYHDVNDDYIVERLYAVAFGCCTGNQTKDYVTEVAQLTYDSLFRGGNPRENILVRDYGKCIVEYAQYIGCPLSIDKDNISSPYCKVKKDVLVPTEDILKYELDYDKTEDKELYYAQKNIMDSMRTEYSSRGLYGDFGRYTFQALLDNWGEDIELVSNYAIKLIFEEIGYEAQVFKKFDGKHSSQLRHKNTIERIGKKYQWIALYKVAAILADNHYNDPYVHRWRGDIIEMARKFDPTLFMNPDIRDFGDTLPAYKVPTYDLSHGSDSEWLKSWKKMPRIEEYIEYEVDGKSWINMFSYYTVSSNSNYNATEMNGKSLREIWTFIQAFMVDKSSRKKMCKVIDRQGLGGRFSTENREVSSIYYREYYWSECYKKVIENKGGTCREYEVGHLNSGIKVQPAYMLYTISEYSDASLTESQEVLMPSPYLYEGLEMRFSVSDGVWLMPDESVACYDSRWVHGGHGGLLIRKDLLIDYLKRNGKCMVWPVLMERTYKPVSTYWPRIQVGGYVWMDDNGKFHHKFRSYEENWKDKWKIKAQQVIKKPLNRAKLFMYNHGLLKMSGTEAIWLMLEVDGQQQKKST